jgi:putative membrane protein
MIIRYNDLAANERTYLAWMRTALALIAFGFVIEKFDLILRTFTISVGKFQELHSASTGRIAGIVLVILGILVMILSTYRFIRTNRHIQSENTESYGILGVLTLGIIFIILAVFVLLYITRLIVIS